ncbi:MAG: hypothetical protein ACOVOT_03670 [Rubrivivax sp.]|jgi:hypothetical protein|nr:hypothetical protein [Rubrivivax sp.]
MAHDARIEGLTLLEAAEVESEWRQLGAVDIRRSDEPGGRFTMTCRFPGSPFAEPVEAAPTPASPTG